MDIELLYFDGCPNWQIARDRLEHVLAVTGRAPARFTLRCVTNIEEAARDRFLGSPTILIDGRDPFSDAAAPVAFACRIYQTEDGPQGAPSVAQLAQALSADT